MRVHVLSVRFLCVSCNHLITHFMIIACEVHSTSSTCRMDTTLLHAFVKQSYESDEKMHSILPFCSLGKLTKNTSVSLSVFQFFQLCVDMQLSRAQRDALISQTFITMQIIGKPAILTVSPLLSEIPVHCLVSILQTTLYFCVYYFNLILYTHSQQFILYYYN